MLRVLRSAAAQHVDRLEAKLLQKAAPAPGADEPEQRPFMSFTARAQGLTIVQDLPISKPFVPSEIDRVAAAKAVQSYAPLYLDLLSGGARLPAVIERLKAVGPVLRLAACSNGDLHLRVSATNVALGAQLQGLTVMPASVACDPGVVDRGASAEEQLHAALSAGEATEVVRGSRMGLRVGDGGGGGGSGWWVVVGGGGGVDGVDDESAAATLSDHP